MNNRKIKLFDIPNGYLNERGWDVDREIGHTKSREVGYLVPSDNISDNQMYQYWREQKIPWSESRVSLLEEAVLLTKNMNGLHLDFGILTGNCIKIMANLLPHKIIYGFDSYKGYPEEFGVLSKGSWAIPPPTDLPSNTELIIGLFQDTLHDFLLEKNQKINIIHIDCDLYDSTYCVLNECYPFLQKGTVVQFNGLFNRNILNGVLYWFNDELTAWIDFVTTKNINWQWIGSQGFSASMKVL